MKDKRGKDERGFTLVETMCALVVLSLCLLLISALFGAVSAEERSSELQLAISRTAVIVMERWRAQSIVPTGSSVQVITLGNVPVTETKTVTLQAGFTQLGLTYSWQEGGRSFVQTWATLHR